MLQSSQSVGSDSDDIVDVVLRASRALVAIAARSIAEVDDAVTLPQFRVLVTLAASGSRNVSALADELGVHASTASRMCDRLEGSGLVEREASTTSRREVIVRLTPKGQQLLSRVTKARRRAIKDVVVKVPDASRTVLVRGLRAFSDAAGEVPDHAWVEGWEGS
jgi:DNA-binding MarR family transcriptional regulator